MADIAPTCIAMIDGLGFSTIEDHSTFNWLTKRASYRPGVGYSFTQKTEILHGLLPNDQGVLNVWQCNDTSPAELSKRSKFLSTFRDILPFADKVLHFFIARCIKGVANIPFEFYGKFHAMTINPYTQNSHSILEDSGWHLIIGDYDIPLNDTNPLDALKKAVEDKTSPLIFAALAELDHIGHVSGPAGNHYINHAQLLSRRLEKIAGTFLKNHPDGRFIVVSDHGMISVNNMLRLKGSTFDLPDNKRAPYWLDSTMLRVWTRTDQETALIKERLENTPYLKVLSDEERHEHGINRRRFGAIICLTEKGTIFRPDHFGVGRPKGMHGYHPDTEGYQPIIGWRNGKDAQECAMPYSMNSVGIYNLLKQLTTTQG